MINEWSFHISQIQSVTIKHASIECKHAVMLPSHLPVVNQCFILQNVQLKDKSGK